jgi:hypothetical protein
LESRTAVSGEAVSSMATSTQLVSSSEPLLQLLFRQRSPPRSTATPFHYKISFLINSIESASSSARFAKSSNFTLAAATFS